ncbi:mating-type protein MAT-1 [Striga asiatica]|uniref:Mating-type protein MAT-1 n=1 Tax=Striga asiatica TaxID=4170 RepID=A0A5A7QSP2_STRAF|nr:mating-type protein MAT-1 [Striga asiatica]
MEERKATNSQSSLLASATDDEIIVSGVLLDLRSLVSLPESLANFNWGRRRRRSCLDEAPSLLPEPSHRPVTFHVAGREIKEIKLRIGAAEEKSGGGGGGATASPTTPLSFSLSESDDKSKCEKISKKMMRNKFPIKEELRMETSGRVSFGADLTRDYRVSVPPHHRPYIPDPTAQFHYTVGPIQARAHASNDGPRYANHVSPLEIDLNFPPAEDFGLDLSDPLDAGRAVTDKRARFAEARRKRRGLMRSKSMRNRPPTCNYEHDFFL